jgi:hypothetical protein
LAKSVILIPDGITAYKFEFATTNGRLSGRVLVTKVGPPDNRKPAEKLIEAKARLKLLAEQFRKVAEEA